MTSSPYALEQQTRLAQQRQHTQLLLQQIAAQGGISKARPAGV